MRGDGNRNGCSWARWLMLLAVLFYSWDIWQQVQEYALIVEHGIFSPAERAEIGVDYQFSCAVKALATLGFLCVFFTWGLDRKARRGALADGICLSALTALWAPVPCLVPLEGGRLLLWGAAELALAGTGAWSWVKYRRLAEQKEETIPG